MSTDVAERRAMNKPEAYARPLADLLRKTLNDAFAQQGFASTELITRWPDIVGAEIAAHSRARKNPMAAHSGSERRSRPRWCCGSKARPQSKSSTCRGVILERVNRFFGWQAVAQLALRQAPLTPAPKGQTAGARSGSGARVAATLGDVTDDGLRDALARLGAAVKPH